jgi:hypothetical protein
MFIKDLSLQQDLGHDAARDVRGGMSVMPGGCTPYPYPWPLPMPMPYVVWPDLPIERDPRVEAQPMPSNPALMV